MGLITTEKLITGFLGRFLPSSLVWKVPTGKKEVFITFDDGPIPGLTGDILSILANFNAPATFFCVGENVVRNPGIYREILQQGHAVGNHSHHHIKGWKTGLAKYMEDVRKASKYVDSNLYRPPYGKITHRQARELLKQYRVIMWTVLTRDFDPAVTPEKCLEIALNGIEPGAIIVFHDNMKAREKVLYALPRLLEYLRSEGYECSKLS